MEAPQRVKKELERLKILASEFYISVIDIQFLRVEFFSTEDSPYVGIPINVYVSIPSSYPFAPCLFSFTPIIFHPNIDKDGRLVYPPLNMENWIPSNTIEKCLVEIKSLFHKPFVC